MKILVCPACQKFLKVHLIDNIQLEVCDSSCAGVWFDYQELQKLVNQPHKGYGTRFLRSLYKEKDIQITPPLKRQCPKCTDTTLNGLSIGKIELEKCPQCQGMWLDYGELHDIDPELIEDKISTSETDHISLEKPNQMTSDQQGLIMGQSVLRFLYGGWNRTPD